MVFVEGGNMTALKLADELEQNFGSYVEESAAMPRAQHEAIKTLREACQDIVWEFGECIISYKCREALAATEEICKD